MSLADSENSLQRFQQLPDAPQQLLTTRIRANDGGVDPEHAIPPIFVAGAVFGDRPQNGRGWAGWLGLKAAGSVPEDSVPFGRGPPGCGLGGFFSPRDGFSLPGLGTRPAEREELSFRNLHPSARQQQTAH